ncbi:helix-turn-helix domain-containing protein [Dyadobacter sp. CY326]|uniref:helix-turn-helix domain-containing protein n=1 Tax=Dyadobacter sp. CY326 TaxID=2907300 RepID=UPI001F381014|nr:helix-turn-helix transcriptional regulator [Dyadobacter sp. CY326]MCE7063721.1 helix-turn-helix transcriptional regulator [Dyadobacter sp. CY326]
MNIFASNLLAKRQEKRLTQAYMAFLSGMSQPNYSDIERGKTRPSIDQLKKFSEILETTADELLSDPKQRGSLRLDMSTDEQNQDQSALLKAIEDKDIYIKILETQLVILLKKSG